MLFTTYILDLPVTIYCFTLTSSLSLILSFYQPDDCIILYLTVLNGSLFLQSEDLTILRNTLAALLTAVAKFNTVFRSEGYQMVVPSLVQVYALHRKNKMVTAAIEYAWIAFYRVNQNLFLLQAISSIANLFNCDVSSLATSLGVNFSPLKFADEEELAGQGNALERASIDLLKCLDSLEDSLPPDPIDMLVSTCMYFPAVLVRIILLVFATLNWQMPTCVFKKLQLKISTI